jgi:hypothetical protein
MHQQVSAVAAKLVATSMPESEQIGVRQGGAEHSTASVHQTYVRIECEHQRSMAPICDAYTASKIPAAPMPVPTHIVTMPYFCLRRRSPCTIVAVRTAPVAPNG